MREWVEGATEWFNKYLLALYFTPDTSNSVVGKVDVRHGLWFHGAYSLLRERMNKWLPLQIHKVTLLEHMFKEMCRVIQELREGISEKKKKKELNPKGCLEMNYEMGSYGEGWEHSMEEHVQRSCGKKQYGAHQKNWKKPRVMGTDWARMRGLQDEAGVGAESTLCRTLWATTWCLSCSEGNGRKAQGWRMEGKWQMIK